MPMADRRQCLAHCGAQERGITLVELLVALTISVVLSAMVVAVWFGLSSGMSYSATSNIQRDSARQALSRVEREIRDAQSRPGNTEPALFRARSYWIAFFTTFNKDGNTDPNFAPHMVMYRLYGNVE